MALRTLNVIEQQTAAMNAQTAEMKRSVDTANRQFAITDRAWVRSEVVLTNGLRTVGDNVNVFAAIIVKNVGRSVATDVDVSARAFPNVWGERSFEEPMRQQHALCDPIRSRPPQRLGSTFMLFPDEQTTRSMSMGLTIVNLREVGDQILKTMREQPMHNSLPYRPALPVIVGCVTNRFQSSGTAHQTGFIYTLNRASDDPHPVPSFFKVDQMDLPLSKLIFDRYFLGGFMRTDSRSENAEFRESLKNL